MSTRTDITSRKDIETLVGRFYNRVQADTLLAPQFSHVDWGTHLPVMYNFWSSMILGEQSYKGSPFQKHMNLQLEEKHFDRWVIIFCETVDGLFEGEKAEEIKFRARGIAGVFQHKMNLIKQTL